jgi:hypothetical protein
MPAVCFVMRNKPANQLHGLEPKVAEAIASIFSGLIDWENEHGQAFYSISTRELYFRLAFIYFARRHTQNVSLKFSFYTGRASERTMRNAIRRFEDQGFIKKSKSQSDHRNKLLIPEDKLIKHFEEHIQEFMRLVQEHFYLIHKDRPKSQN